MVILIALVVVVILMVVAASKFKFHPFLSLLLAGIVMGFVGGLNEEEVISSLMNGFGKTLGSIGIIIAFGTIIGAYLEKSGGAKTLANWALKTIGEKRSVLAMNITGFIVSIPVYCDSGFIILSSLNKAISKSSKIPLVVLGVSLAAGLYATHVFVPPTPGPLAATAALDANLGLVILLGLAVAIPVALSGYFWAKYLERKIGPIVLDGSTEHRKVEKLPKTSASFIPILVPIILIALKSIAGYPTHPFGEATIFGIINFIGNPIVALLIGVFLAFKLKSGHKEETHFNWVTSGLKEAGIIILITGGRRCIWRDPSSYGYWRYYWSKFCRYAVRAITPIYYFSSLKIRPGILDGFYYYHGGNNGSYPGIFWLGQCIGKSSNCFVDWRRSDDGLTFERQLFLGCCPIFGNGHFNGLKKPDGFHFIAGFNRNIDRFINRMDFSIMHFIFISIIHLF